MMLEHFVIDTISVLIAHAINVASNVQAILKERRDKTQDISFEQTHLKHSTMIKPERSWKRSLFKKAPDLKVHRWSLTKVALGKPQIHRFGCVVAYSRMMSPTSWDS